MRMIDSHTHLDNHRPEKLLEMVDHFHYEKFGVMAIPCNGDPLNTLECLLVKKLAPERAYVFGGMVYLPNLEPTAQSHEHQLRLMLDAGFDGWKLLESKPSVYRRLQLPLDGAAFSRAFALAEEAQLAVTWHAGDPATFWSAETAPRFAVENHWLCVGEGFPSLPQIYGEVENVLARHPKLCASMAHLYFTSDDRAHAERVLDAYENLWFDLTPGSEMYHDFLADREGWRAFFDRYQDKLVFGSDMVDDEGDVVFSSQDSIVDFVVKTLAGSEPFQVQDVSGTGLGLSEQILGKIFRENFLRRVGPAPKPIDPAGLNAYAEWLLPLLSTEDRARAEAMLAKF